MNLKLENNSVLVIPNNIKKQVISYINNNDSLLNIKIMTFNDLKKGLYFSYDEDAIFYIMDKYKVKYTIAKIYLENMYYTCDKKIESPKFKFLDDLKKELLDNNLLIIDNYFSLLFNRKFYIYGYNHLDKFYLNMLKSIPNVEIIKSPNYKEKKLEVVEFDNIVNECEYVIRNICKLIDSGIDINNIKIANIDKEYTNELKRLSKFYNLPIDFDNNSSIYSTKIAKEYIGLLKNNLSFEEVIGILKDKYSDTYIIKKLIDLSNKFIGLNYDRDLIIESIIYNLKMISTDSKQFNKSIEFVDLENNDLSKYHVFVLGLNEGIIPKTFKDEEYFSDKEKEALNLDTSKERNKNIKLDLITNFYSIDNLYLGYSLNNTKEQLYPSSIISTYDMKVIHKDIDRTISYSSIADKIYYTNLLDNYTKYGEINNDLVLLNSNYNILYKTYDNSFNGIDNNNLLNYIKELKLSYSSMDNYYRCAFRYYIDNILKLNTYEDTFSIFIGNLFHYILSLCNSDFDFEKEWEAYLSKRVIKKDEEVFLVKLKKELLFIVNYVNKFNKETGLNNMYLEKKISIDKSNIIPVEFKGFVDKIMYKDDLVSIIDYKSGNASINLNNCVYGIGMQLPVYLYLIMKSNIFNNPKIVGIYLQHILNNNKNINDKESSLKLIGYSTNKEEYLSVFDPTYENSLYIKGMKKSKNGFYSYTKLLTENDINCLFSLTDKKIDEAINYILKGDFSINPKRIGKELVGCSYCKYRDLCFMREKDIIDLEEITFTIGGEDND